MKDMKDIKLCINCKHARFVGFMVSVVACHHPESDGWETSPVDGKETMSTETIWKSYCETARKFGICGINGKYFEQKELKQSFFARIFNFIKNEPLG